MCNPQTDWTTYLHRYERWTDALRTAECDRRQRSRLGRVWQATQLNTPLWRARSAPAKACKLFLSRGLYA